MQSSDTSNIDQLPDALLLFILSFLPTLAEIARTSVLSRRWRNLWHYITCLDFDVTLVLPMERWTTSQDWYLAWVNKVIDVRVDIPLSTSLKVLRIRYPLSMEHKQHINRWVDFAIANRVETLHLELRWSHSYSIKLYKLSKECWSRAPSGFGSLNCLKSLVLQYVDVDAQFIHFILSSCPQFEDLWLKSIGTFNGLDVSGAPPLRLKRLFIYQENNDVLSKLCAPYLTSFYFRSRIFDPQKIDVPMLRDLTIGSGWARSITNYLAHMWAYLPQLEKLELIMSKHQKFSFTRLPELAKLKYLKICADWDTDLAFYPIIKFINSAPLLETFALEVFDPDEIPSRLFANPSRRKEEWWRSDGENNYSFKCLKVLELYGADGKTLDQEVVKCIVRGAPNLEKVIVYINTASSYFFKCNLKPEIIDGVEAKVEELCRERPLNIEIKNEPPLRKGGSHW